MNGFDPRKIFSECDMIISGSSNSGTIMKLDASVFKYLSYTNDENLAIMDTVYDYIMEDFR